MKKLILKRQELDKIHKQRKARGKKGLKICKKFLKIISENSSTEKNEPKLSLFYKGKRIMLV